MERPETAGGRNGLRAFNRQRVLAVLQDVRALTRSDLSRLTGLSRTTLTHVIADLQREGLVVVHGVDRPAGGHRGSGRPAALLALVRPSGLVVGVDLGHAHLRVVTADLAGNVLAERVADLDIDRNADAALDASATFISELLAETGAPRAAVAAVVLGLPGPLRHEVVGSSSILPGWTNLAPAAALERRIGLRVRVDNDANLGALGEATFGAARGIEDVIYVKVSTGIGAGLVLGGRLYRGATGGAGELGHVRVNEQGVVCRCGSRGCLETLVSAPAIIATLQPAHTAPLNTELIVALAREGDPGTRRVLGDAGRQIGRAVADLCIALDPAAIVVGGELARASDVLLDGIRQSIDNYAQPSARQDVRVLAGGLGDRAEALGAIALAIETAAGSPAVGVGSV